MNNEFEHERLLHFSKELMKISRQTKDERVTSFLSLVAKNIETYEARRFPLGSISPVEVLKFIMEEHGLGQNDLPGIGSQSLISKILSGERQLTVEHISYLSKRFGISPSVFIESDRNMGENYTKTNDKKINR